MKYDITADCQNCAFWRRQNSDNKMFGICHRYPPVPTAYSDLNGDEIFDTYWPTTQEEDFCGEWQDGRN